MAITTRSRLLALTNREFKELAQEQPQLTSPDQPFKRRRLRAAAYGRGWELKRGAAVRFAVVLLNDDHQAMERRVCGDERTAKTYAGTADWLAREAEYMRKTARMLDTARSRLGAILERCQARAPQVSGGAPV